MKRYLIFSILFFFVPFITFATEEVDISNTYYNGYSYDSDSILDSHSNIYSYYQTFVAEHDNITKIKLRLGVPDYYAGMNYRVLFYQGTWSSKTYIGSTNYSNVPYSTGGTIVTFSSSSFIRLTVGETYFFAIQRRYSNYGLRAWRGWPGGYSNGSWYNLSDTPSLCCDFYFITYYNTDYELPPEELTEIELPQSIENDIIPNLLQLQLASIVFASSLYAIWI